jgi:hypothetical protein
VRDGDDLDMAIVQATDDEEGETAQQKASGVADVRMPGFRFLGSERMEFDRRTSARGESAANLCPGNRLDGSAIEFRDPPVHLRGPSGLRVFVDLGVKTVEQ